MIILIWWKSIRVLNRTILNITNDLVNMSLLLKYEKVMLLIWGGGLNAAEKYKETLRRSDFSRAICPTLLTMFSCHYLSYFARILVLLWRKPFLRFLHTIASSGLSEVPLARPDSLSVTNLTIMFSIEQLLITIFSSFCTLWPSYSLNIVS